MSDEEPRIGVNGIGGVFIYANDAKSLSEWYAKHFGLSFTHYPEYRTYGMEFVQRDDPDRTKRETTVFAVHESEKKLPDDRFEFMINFRVSDLGEFLDQLRESRISIEKTQDYDYGLFAWIRDPEGNRIELYQPL